MKRLSALLEWRNRIEHAHHPLPMRRVIRVDAGPGAAGRALRGVPSRAISLSILLGLGVAAGMGWYLGRRQPVLDHRPGGTVADFELPDPRTGQSNRYSDYRGRVLVIVFVGTSCPVGDLYLPRLIELSKQYEFRGVDFLAINSNESDTGEDVADYARRMQATIPILKDANNRVADQLLAERTCEALVIDERCVLRYRGAIDDQYGLGSRKDQPRHHFLIDALEDVLVGRPVSVEMTPVVGCPIERVALPGDARSSSRGRSSKNGVPGTGVPATRNYCPGVPGAPERKLDAKPCCEHGRKRERN